MMTMMSYDDDVFVAALMPVLYFISFRLYAHSCTVAVQQEEPT